MDKFEPLFLSINKLSCKIASKLEQGELEQLPALLSERLTFLQSLDQTIHSQQNSPEILARYQQLLTEVQQQDNTHQKKLSIERSEILSTSNKQSKSKAAISVYKNIHLG